MIISDNLIITDSFKSISKRLEEFKNIIQTQDIDQNIKNYTLIFLKIIDFF